MNEKEKKKVEAMQRFLENVTTAKETAERHLQAACMRSSERLILKTELEEIGTQIKYCNSNITDLLKEEPKTEAPEVVERYEARQAGIHKQ